MSLVVNTNVSSINAQRNLAKVGRSMTKSLERLSSGLRINHSSDDAAGLAIATGMRSQIQGLEQAVRNAGDGLSALGTADAAVAEEVTILQRIRTLAVQAANEVNNSANLETIQQEIGQMTAELTRIGTTTDFNGQNLIDGTFANKSIQVGAFAQQTIEVSIGDFRATGMGAFAQIEGAVTTTAQAGTTGTLMTGVDLISPGNLLKINDVEIDAPIDDNISTALSDQSAIAKATAINRMSSQTGVTATYGETTLVGSGVLAGFVAPGANDTFVINDVVVIDEANGVGMITVTANDGDSSLRNEINKHSLETGVVATLDAGNKLVLTADDGRNIEVHGVGMLNTEVGFAVAVDGRTQAGTPNHANANITLHSNDAIQIQAANASQIGLSTSTISVDSTKTVQKIDVTAVDGASNAILSVDSAINEIVAAQARIGAQVNRFEHTIDNLQVSIENMSAAESRIRDTDFAIETANLTRTQIIQQAGTAMLSQANMKPQAALSLLG